MSKYNNKVAAIIPFYNESGKIDKVINKVLQFVEIVICVDDGSLDDYYTPIFLDHRVQLIKHEKNYGKGKALNSGISAAIKKNMDYVICIDGDLQHDPNFIPTFLTESANYDIVIGKRNFKSVSMPISRKMSNFFSSKILSILSGRKILDSQSGYRLIKLKIFDNIVVRSNGFEAETELLLKASFNGYNIGFIPISTIYSENDDSKIKNLNSIIGFVKIIVNCFYEKYKKKTKN